MKKILGILATQAPILYIGVQINNSSDHSLFFYIATKVLCIIVAAVTVDEMCPVTCTESMVESQSAGTGHVIVTSLCDPVISGTVRSGLLYHHHTGVRLTETATITKSVIFYNKKIKALISDMWLARYNEKTVTQLIQYSLCALQK